ncbi:MAG: ABC transporter permease, partial [Oscillospiraceae bacterium]
MLKLSIKLLCAKKNICCVLITIVLLSCIYLLTTSLSTTFNLHMQKISAFNTYGEFTTIIGKMDSNDFNLISDNMSETKIGIISVFNDIDIVDDSSITVGHMDKSAFDLSHIKLKAGRMPSKADEVVVEEFVAQNLNIKSALNNNVTINDITFKIVGIIYNYSFNWSTPLNMQKKQNNFPNIFTYNNSLFSHKILNGIMYNPNVIKNDGSISHNESMEQLLNLGFNYEQIQSNYNLFNKGLRYYTQMYWWSIIFLLLIIVTSAFCYWNVLRLFYKDYIRKFSIFHALGMTLNGMKTILLIQMLCTFCFCLVSSLIIFSFIQNLIYKNSANEEVCSISNGVKVLLIYLTILASILMALFAKIVFEIKSQNISHDIVISDKKLSCKKSLDYKKHLFYSCSYLVVIMLTLIVLSTFISGYLYSKLEDVDEQSYDYSIFNKKILETEVYNNFILETNPDT